MKFFDAIFKKKKEAETTANTSVSKSKEAQSLKELEGFLQKLQESDHYIARSEYYEQVREYAETVSFMRKMDEADMLVEFCSKNGLSPENVRELCINYENIVPFVDNINENYLSRRKNKRKPLLPTYSSAGQKRFDFYIKLFRFIMSPYIRDIHLCHSV